MVNSEDASSEHEDCDVSHTIDALADGFPLAVTAVADLGVDIDALTDVASVFILGGRGH